MSHRLNPAILREYDIRGVVGRSLFEQDAWVIGYAFAGVLREKAPSTVRPAVVVGRDGRLSSPMLEAALVQGLSAGGVDVIRIGLSTTPMLYYAEVALRASGQQVQGGIQVTGSHNPKDHNGFKIVAAGAPFFGRQIVALGERIAGFGPVEPLAGGGFGLGGGSEAGAAGLGGEIGVEHGSVEFREFLVAYADRLLADLHGVDPGKLAALRIGWDTGHGAAGPLVEALTARLPGEHHLLFTDVDGHFPHHHPDPTVEENLADLRNLVLSRRLDFGVAFDGDADRVGLVDGQGRVVWGDQTLLILARDLLARQPGALILADVKASQALFDGVTALGGQAQMWKTGHSLIKSRMKETGAALAGEMTGHLFFAEDWYGFDDAMLAVLRLMAASVRLGCSITDLRSAMPEMASTPELRIPVAEGQAPALVARVREAVVAAGGVVDETDGIRVSLADGWWLLRASNTEAKLSARAEGRDPAALGRVLEDLDARLGAVGVVRG